MLIRRETTEHLLYFVVPSENREKLKESKKIDKYLDLPWELEKLWNMKVTVIPVIAGWVTKRLGSVLEIKSRIETIQTTAQIGKDNEESPGNRKRHAVTET